MYRAKAFKTYANSVTKYRLPTLETIKNLFVQKDDKSTQKKCANSKMHDTNKKICTCSTNMQQYVVAGVNCCGNPSSTEERTWNAVGWHGSSLCPLVLNYELPASYSFSHFYTFLWEYLLFRGIHWIRLMGVLNLEITDSLFFGKYIMEGFAARYENFLRCFQSTDCTPY